MAALNLGTLLLDDFSGVAALTPYLSGNPFCLVYASDAADEEDRGVAAGRRIRQLTLRPRSDS